MVHATSIRDKLTFKSGFRVGFRDRISSQDSGFRVRISSQDLELGFRVRISSQDLVSGFRVVKREKTFIGLFIWSQVIFHLFLQIVPLFVVVSGEDKMRHEFAEWYVAWPAAWHNYEHMCPGGHMCLYSRTLFVFITIPPDRDNLPEGRELAETSPVYYVTFSRLKNILTAGLGETFLGRGALRDSGPSGCEGD